MTGWLFVAFLITAVSCWAGGTLFGAQWVRDDQAARQAARAARPRPGWLPLYCDGPNSAAGRRQAAIRQHPAGGGR